MVSPTIWSTGSSGDFCPCAALSSIKEEARGALEGRLESECVVKMIIYCVIAPKSDASRGGIAIMPRMTTGFIIRPHARIQIALVLDVAYLPRS